MCTSLFLGSIWSLENLVERKVEGKKCERKKVERK